MMTDVNVVLLGEIDSGKSTLINYLANLFENGSLDQLKIAVPIGSASSTNEKICSKYSFVVDNVSLNFFDTPGFSTDEQTINAIVHCLLNLSSLSALIFVLNGSQSRLTTTFRFVLTQLYERIGGVLTSNLIVVLTRCNAHTVNFDAKTIFQDLPIFYMQNSAFASDRQSWSRETRRFLQIDWNSSIRTLNEILEKILQFSPIPTASLADYAEQENAFRSFLHQTRLTIEKLQRIEEEFEGMTDTSELNERIQTKKIKVNEISVTPFDNTICLQCNIVCHERCTLNEDNILRRCQVMNNGRCTICPQRCSFDRHYHDQRSIKPVERTIKFALTSSDQPKRFRSIDEMKNLIEKSFDEIEQICRTFQKKSKFFNVSKDLTIFVNLIENQLKTFRPSIVVHRTKILLEQMKNFADEETTTTVKKKPKIKTRREPTPIETNFSEFSTEHLISLIRQSNERIRLINEELVERYAGHSIGYLSPNELAKLCEFYASYRLLSPEDLQQIYSQFQIEIQEKTDGKATELLSVPMDIFLQYLAIQFCLKTNN